MAKVDKGGTVTLQELVVSSLAQSDALAKFLIEKGLVSEAEFMEREKRGLSPFPFHWTGEFLDRPADLCETAVNLYGTVTAGAERWPCPVEGA